MITGIVLALAKLLILIAIIWWKEEKSWNWEHFGWKQEWDKSIIKNAICTLIVEIVIVVGTWVTIDELYIADKQIGDLAVQLLTTFISIGWMGFYIWSLYKVLIKFSAKI